MEVNFSWHAMDGYNFIRIKLGQKMAKINAKIAKQNCFYIEIAKFSLPCNDCILQYCKTCVNGHLYQATTTCIKQPFGLLIKLHFTI